MKLKRIIAMGLGLAMVMSIATACSSGSTSSKGDSSKEAGNADQLTFGWSVYTRDGTFFQTMEQGVLDKADELNIEVLTHDQKNKSDEMVTGCTNLINQGVDALIVSPCKPEAMGTIVELAHAKDIPVIICDIGDGGSDKDAIIVSDMFGGGELAGKYAVQLLKESSTSGKDIAIIDVEESATYALRRAEGFKSIVEKEGYTIATQITANSDQAKGYEAMSDIIASNPQIVAVFAANDPMAVGAVEALQEKGRTDIMMFGFNGDQIALDKIADGAMMGTVAQDPAGIGALGVELAKQKVEGKEIEFDNAQSKEIFSPVKMIGKDGKEVKFD